LLHCVFRILRRQAVSECQHEQAAMMPCEQFGEGVLIAAACRIHKLFVCHVRKFLHKLCHPERNRITEGGVKHLLFARAPTHET
jgi:hypothetical protein